MRKWVGRLARAVTLIVVALLLSSTATPQLSMAVTSHAVRSPESSVDEVPIASVVNAHGSVSVVRAYGTAEERIMFPVKNGLLLFRGDQIWTGENSWIEVQFEEAARVRVGASSRVVVVAGLVREIDPVTNEELPTLRLLVGRVWVHVAEALSRLRNFSVETPSAIAGVRGTIFMVEAGVTGKSVVSVYEGVVAVASPSSPRNEYLVGAAEEVEVLPEQLPSVSKEFGSDPSRRWHEMQQWLQEQAAWKASGRQSGEWEDESLQDFEGKSGFDGFEGPDGSEGDEAQRGLVGSIFAFLARLFRMGGSGSGGGSGSSPGSDSGQGEGAPSNPDDGLKLPGSLPIGVPVIPRVFSLTDGEVEPSDGSPDREVPKKANDGVHSAEFPEESDASHDLDPSAGEPGSDGNRDEDRDGNRGAGPGGNRGVGPDGNRGKGPDGNRGKGSGKGDDESEKRRGVGPPENRGRASAPGLMKKRGGDEAPVDSAPADSAPDDSAGESATPESGST